MCEANNGNASPEQSLAIADAMAIRDGRLEAVSEQILAGLQGLSYEAKTPEEMRKAHIGRTVLYLAKVEDPDAPFTLAELVDATRSNGSDAYVGAAEAVDENVGAEIKASFMRDTMGEIQSAMEAADEEIAKDFARTLTAAKEVAADHGTDVATVYATDELYYEACRRIYSPVGTAEQLCRGIDSFSVEMINKVMIRQLGNMLPRDLLDKISPEELAEMAAEMQLRPEIQSSVAHGVELSKEAIRQAAIHLFVSIHGVEEMKNLPSHYRLALMPRRPLVLPELFDALS